MDLGRKDSYYQICIKFKPDTGRDDIAGLILIRQYRRMIRDFQRGKSSGTYWFKLDNSETNLTFPLQEMDTITAVPHDLEV